MKKSLVMSIVALTMGLSVHAVRAVHQLFPQRQSDGTTVMLYTIGDGKLAFYTTADHQVVIPNSEGTLCYAALKNGVLVPTSVAVHNIGERSAQEIAFVKSNTLKPTDKALESLLQPQPFVSFDGKNIKKAMATSTADGLGSYGVSALGAIPTIGNVKIPVIMVEFSDVKFQENSTIEKISRFMNEEGYHDESDEQKGSVRDYFVSQSRGMFTPDFDVVAKVSLDRTCAYYGANNGNYKDTRASQLVKDAVNGAISQGVDFSKFEVKYSVPNVIILYAGYGEATGGSPSTIWPHELTLPDNYAIGDYLFGSYFMGNELYGSDGDQLMGMGVMVHELSHALGLPDFYETSYSYQYQDQPMSSWSVMDGGEYYPGNSAYAPVGYTAYERSFMGWLDLKELKDAESVTLLNSASEEGEFAKVLRNPSNDKEYFILENHNGGTWYPSSLGTGLLVYRVAYDASAWSKNTVNKYQDRKRMMTVTASGRKMVGNGMATDLFGNCVNNKTDFVLLDGSTIKDASIYNVLKHPDGMLTLNFKDKSLVNEYTVSNEDEVYEKVVDSSSLSVNDNIVFVNENDKMAMTLSNYSNAFNPVRVKIDNGKLYGNGYISTLKLQKSGSNWVLRNDGLYLTANNSGVKFTNLMSKNSIASITIANGDASVVFTGNASCNKLSFSPDNYYFSTFAEAQSNLQIYRKTGTTGISTVNAGVEKQTDGRMYNLSGQQVGDGYKGIVIVNGKKVIRK